MNTRGLQYDAAALAIHLWISTTALVFSTLREEDVAADAAALLAYARRLHRYAEAACTGELTPAQEKQVANLQHRVDTVAAEYGVAVKHSGDPRGYVVKFLFPSGVYNTGGGKEEGWGI